MLKVDIPLLDDFNKIRSIELSDFAVCLGADLDYLNNGYIWTKNLYDSYDYNSMVINFSSDNHHIFHTRSDDNTVATWPVIYYDSISDDNSAIIFGKWPDKVVSDPSTIAKLLGEISYDAKWTKYKYPVYIDSKLVYLSSFMYKNKEYVTFDAHFTSYKRILSDKNFHKNNERVFIEVCPIEWYNYRKEKKLLAKKALIAGIPLSLKEKYDGNPDFMLNYLNRLFIKAIMQNEEMSLNPSDADLDDSKNTPMNEKSRNINSIVNEIEELSRTYYGDENINAKVNALIDKYNDDIVQALNKKENGLSLEYTKSEETLYLYLITELEDIKAMLKLNNEKYRAYKDMIELTNVCLDILNGENNHDEYPNSFKEDIFAIKTVILPFLEDNNILEELKEIFVSEKENIISYIRGEKDHVPIDYTTFNDFILMLRKRLHPLLIELNKQVRNKDLVNEIVQGYNSIMLNNYENSKNSYLNNIFAEIQNLIDEIVSNGNEEDSKKLQIIKNKEIDFNRDIVDILKDIDETYKSLYSIVIDIEKRREKNKRVSDYTVTLSRTK